MAFGRSSLLLNAKKLRRLRQRGDEHCAFCPFPTAAAASAAAGRLGELRFGAHRFLDDAWSSRYARVWSLLIMALILVSTVSFCLETLPSLEGATAVWTAIEGVVVAVFTLEYGLRLWASARRAWFIVHPLNVVDLFAILPFYLELALDSTSTAGLRVLRVVRLARVFRLVKIGRYSSYLRILTDSLVSSANAFGLMTFFTAIAMVIFSTAIYFAEKDADRSPDPNPFSSIASSFYWAIVTMTTLGYGDVYPVTLAGRVVAAFAMVFGVIVIALPISVLSSNFHDIYTLHKVQRQRTDSSRSGLEVILREHISKLRKYRLELDDVIHQLQQHVEARGVNDPSNMEHIWQSIDGNLKTNLSHIEEFLGRVVLAQTLPHSATGHVNEKEVR